MACTLAKLRFRCPKRQNSDFRRNANSHRWPNRSQSAIDVEILLSITIQACPLFIDDLCNAQLNAQKVNPNLPPWVCPLSMRSIGAFRRTCLSQNVGSCARRMVGAPGSTPPVLPVSLQSFVLNRCCRCQRYTTFHHG